MSHSLDWTAPGIILLLLFTSVLVGVVIYIWFIRRPSEHLLLPRYFILYLAIIHGVLSLIGGLFFTMAHLRPFESGLGEVAEATLLLDIMLLPSYVVLILRWKWRDRGLLTLDQFLHVAVYFVTLSLFALAWVIPWDTECVLARCGGIVAFQALLHGLLMLLLQASLLFMFRPERGYLMSLYVIASLGALNLLLISSHTTSASLLKATLAITTFVLICTAALLRNRGFFQKPFWPLDLRTETVAEE